MTLKLSDLRVRAAGEAARTRSQHSFRLGLTLALCLFCAIFAAPALAAPTHQHKLPLDISGFNHACGTAVDSEGDVYVSSSGESEIKIFNPAHVKIGAILSVNEPCGLAVDSAGKLYAFEKATGDVVRYVPDEFPFAGSPSYGPPESIDSSGTAKAISVDPVDDRLYVANGDRIDSYDSEGMLGANEVQSVRVPPFAIGGTFVLCFDGSCTPPLPYNASHAEVEAALTALPTIGAGNISIAEGPVGPRHHLVTFEGKFSGVDVELIDADPSGLEGEKNVFVEELIKGFNGHIAQDPLADYAGVAAYTYVSVGGLVFDRYLFVADASTDQVKILAGPDVRALKLHRSISGVDHDQDSGTVDQSFDFESIGTYMAADPGNGNAEGKCAPIGEQACTAGHFLVYDSGNNVVDEFDATGEFLDQFTNPGLIDAKPTALAVDRSSGVNDGTIYLTSGAGVGSKLLAFGPLAIPSRTPLGEPLSKKLATARAVATDPNGYVYVAAGSFVHVYGPNGKEIKVGPEGKGIPTPEPAKDLAIDSACNVYTLIAPGGPDPASQRVQYYAPSACPPGDGTTYSGPTTVADGNSFLTPTAQVRAIGVNHASDELFVASDTQILILDSAKEGSAIVDSCFGCELSLDVILDIDTYIFNSNVYVSTQNGGIIVVDATGSETLARITGGGGSKGPFGGPVGTIAVDQSNGHVLAFNQSRKVALEYDASGAFVAEFGKFTPGVGGNGIAIDNSGGVSDGTVYVAYDDPSEPFDLVAFGPLAYGEPPIAVTDTATDIGGGQASLNGSVDPRGFIVEDCHFDYLLDATYKSNGSTFAGAFQAPCVPGPGGIGKGIGPIAVKAQVSGLVPGERYRFLLVAKNEYGDSKSKTGLFGPPRITEKEALPVLYDEATLRAEVDPSGLATEYHFEYGPDETYSQSTPFTKLPAGDGSVPIEVPLTGLTEGTEYHFRVVAENEAGTVLGLDQIVKTRKRPTPPPCSNTEYRTGLSAKLPDCRAYELVTPADTRGLVPGATISGNPAQQFNNWLVAPRGDGAGESVAYFTETLPGFEGSGGTDGYRALRGDEPHPAAGWVTSLFGPSYAQIGLNGTGRQHSVAADQRHWLYEISGASEAFPETLPQGQYLRTPGGVSSSPCNPKPSQADFELVGCGSLGTDPAAESRYVSAGGSHVIFFSKAHLEDESGNEAAPVGTVAIYDRRAGDASAEVISVGPGDAPFGAGQDATYLASTEDGTAVVFEVGGILYVRRGAETIEIAEAPNTFAGISSDGSRVFYAAAASGEAPASLFVCDAQAGPCAGVGAHSPTKIADESIFLNVSSSSSVLFTSEAALTGSEENEAGEIAEAGEPNLYAWDGVTAAFVAILNPQDFTEFGGNISINLLTWTKSVTAGIGIGRNNSPTRATPDGEIFVFQSHAQLTSFDNKGKGEIYRYNRSAESGQRLICVSCDSTGAPASADAQLLVYSGGAGVVKSSTLVPNVTDDGSSVFFQSPDQLLPEDVNSAQDVYEWKALGVGAGGEGCDLPSGCLALVSSGQSEAPSYLYGMSADGRDVFFETPEKLVGADIPGSPSIYDARVEGGIPDPPIAEPCHGDACQPLGNGAPTMSVPASTAAGEGNLVSEGGAKCPKNKRKVRRKGSVRCVKKQQGGKKHTRSNHRGHHDRRNVR